MRSLRTRLMLGMMAAVAIVWTAWFGWQAVQVSTQQSGLHDVMLKSVGQQILASLPRLDDVSGQPEYRLPPQVEARPEKGSWQVWLRDGRAALRSTGSPLKPMAPLSFEPGDKLVLSQVDDTDWRVYTITDAKGQVTVQVGKSHEQLHAVLWLWMRASLGIVALLLGLLGWMVWAVICRSLWPVHSVSAALSQRDAFDLQPVPDHGLPKEVQPLIEAFNKLLGRLDAALQAERRFIADAAHELRTPLAALMAQAQLAQSAGSLQQARDALTPLVDGIQRSARLTEQLLDLARLDASREPVPAGMPTPLHEIVALVVQDFDAAARQRRQRLLLHAEPCSVDLDIDMLGVLLRNLIDNALRYSGEGTRVEVLCRCEERDGGTCVVLSVRDDGPGVPCEERQRIFDRFYRITGNAAPGSGIGLSLVARIAQLHGAKLDVGDGLDGRGLGITLRFAQVRMTPSTSPTPGAAGAKSLLGPTRTA